MCFAKYDNIHMDIFNADVINWISPNGCHKYRAYAWFVFRNVHMVIRNEISIISFLRIIMKCANWENLFWLQRIKIVWAHRHHLQRSSTCEVYIPIQIFKSFSVCFHSCSTQYVYYWDDNIEQHVKLIDTQYFCHNIFSFPAKDSNR